jgi:protein-disulfide isomerase
MKRSIRFVIPVAFVLVIAAAGFAATDEPGHALGPASAPVTLEEYADFECPSCAKLSDPLNELAKEFGPRLRVVFHHYPLAEHKYARQAALAAEAAGLQGKFWEMHDILYKDQEVWANTTGDVGSLFDAYAGYIGLNVTRFKSDMVGDEVRARVTADLKKVISLGIHTTPTVFINNKQVDPKHLNEADLRAEIETALKDAKASH